MESEESIPIDAINTDSGMSFFEKNKIDKNKVLLSKTFGYMAVKSYLIALLIF